MKYYRRDIMTDTKTGNKTYPTGYTPQLKTVFSNNMFHLPYMILISGGEYREKAEVYLTEDDFSGIKHLVISELIQRGLWTHPKLDILDYSLELMPDDQLLQILNKLDVADSYHLPPDISLEFLAKTNPNINYSQVLRRERTADELGQNWATDEVDITTEEEYPKTPDDVMWAITSYPDAIAEKIKDVDNLIDENDVGYVGDSGFIEPLEDGIYNVSQHDNRTGKDVLLESKVLVWQRKIDIMSCKVAVAEFMNLTGDTHYWIESVISLENNKNLIGFELGS